jgi:XTP/dITP diphosphohydrolase
MQRIVLATRNQHKVAEVRRILQDAEYEVELLGSDAYADLPDIPETGNSFAANAILKARAVCEHTGLPAIADDSGLAVDALNGMPGIYSAHWAGAHGDDAANLQLLLAQMAEVPDGRRSAAFICAAAVVTPDGDERVVEGSLEGVIVHAPRGSNGFGYDPIFLPRGHDRTTAEMSAEEKDVISHRGQAFRALAEVLRAGGGSRTRTSEDTGS